MFQNCVQCKAYHLKHWSIMWILATEIFSNTAGFGEYKSATHLFYAYAHNTWDDEFKKLAGFLCGHKIFTFFRGLYGFEPSSERFTTRDIFFKNLLRQGSSLVYIVDILFKWNSKPHMLQIMKQLHDTACKKVKISFWKKLFSYISQ